MLNALAAAAALLITLAAPARASAWGFEAHKYITGRAIDLLPPELKPFYDHYRDEIVMRSVIDSTCGLVKRPVRRPRARTRASIIREVEVLPLVPVRWTTS